MNPNMKTISFFSYKGGACRTSTAYNTVPYIARALNASKERPLVVLDMDFNSVGMSLLLGFKHGENEVTLLDFACPRNTVPQWDVEKVYDRGEHDVLRLLKPVGHKFGQDDDESILFAGTAAEDTYYMTNVQKNESFFADLNRLFKTNDYAGLILDLPTGWQTVATACREISDTIVVCMRPTRQFFDGTKRFIEVLIGKRASKAPKFVILPTAVPEDIKDDGGNSRHEKLRADLGNMTSTLNERKTELKSNCRIVSDMIGRNSPIIGIPEVTLFKWSEENLFCKVKNNGYTPKNDEADAAKQYEKLANTVLKD